MSSRIWLRRAYEPPTRNDGRRVLIDRLWPRGVRRADARIDDWLPELAPSTELRTWFGHDPALFAEFERRYRDELTAHDDALDRVGSWIERGRVTLVFGARDTEHSNAVVLRKVLEERADTGAGPGADQVRGRPR
jgi:uncharacterized protein YeaO (DUF488 family)